MVKNMLRRRRFASALALLLCVAWVVVLVARPAAWAQPAAADDARFIVADWRTGLALHGIDPISYFADGRPIAGQPAVEFNLSGVVWRFRHDANRTAFAAEPGVYLPRFAGHDPVAIARGVATPGNPRVFLVHGNRLYLFHAAETLATFRAAPAATIAAAEAKWPELRARLAVTGSTGVVRRGEAASPPFPGPHRQ